MRNGGRMRADRPRIRLPGLLEKQGLLPKHCIGNGRSRWFPVKREADETGDTASYLRLGFAARNLAREIPDRNSHRTSSLVKFHLSTATGNVVTGLGPGWIRVGAAEHRENVVLMPNAIATGWAPSGFDGLVDDDFARLLDSKPEVVLFGSGSAIRFPHPRLTRALTDAGVGLEVMDTPAACRTFNILAAEGRNVVAALLLK